MRFEITQRYESTAGDVNAAYANPDLYPTLVGLPKLGGIEVLSHESTMATARLSVRFRFIGHLPAAVTAVVEPQRLTWIQESIHDLAAGTATFRLLPDHYADRLEAAGTFAITDSGNGSQRVVNGELKVRVLLVSGSVERAIVSGLQEYLVAEAPAVDSWLRR